eukprot:6201137-Pleurochrysis_carterae.AAC.3
MSCAELFSRSRICCVHLNRSRFASIALSVAHPARCVSTRSVHAHCLVMHRFARALFSRTPNACTL